MNIKICDGCGEKITGRKRVAVQVHLRWNCVELFDFHAERGCLLKLAKIVRDLKKELNA